MKRFHALAFLVLSLCCLLLPVRVSAKAAWDYERFVIVRWQDNSAVSGYPVYLGSVDFYGKVQSDFDDVRVSVDGSMIDFWQHGFSATQSAQTRLWTNMNFVAGQTNTLKSGISTTGTLASMDLVSSTVGLPSTNGYILIDNEVMKYATKNDSLRTLYNVSRAQMGTTAATHAANASAEWIQHYVMLKYGSASAVGMQNDDDYKPPFELSDSSNESWHYKQFGGDAGDSHSLSYASWGKNVSFPGCFSFPTEGNPWTEVGVFYSGSPCSGRNAVYIKNDVGIKNIYFAHGETVIEQEWPHPALNMTAIRSTDADPNSDPYYWTNNYTLIPGGTFGVVFFSGLDLDISPVRSVVGLYDAGWPGAWSWIRTEEATIEVENYPLTILGAEL